MFFELGSVIKGKVCHHTYIIAAVIDSDPDLKVYISTNLKYTWFI